MAQWLKSILNATLGHIGRVTIRAWNVLTIIALLATGSGVAVVVTRLMSHASQPQSNEQVTETTLVLFSQGVTGVHMRDSFTGSLTVTVRGGGQMGGSTYTDAFYTFADFSTPSTPEPSGSSATLSQNAEPSASGLWINGSPASRLIQPLPLYDPSHTYTFSLHTPQTPLTFAAGPAPASNRSGAFIITATGASSAPQLDFSSSPVKDASAQQVLDSGHVDQATIAAIKGGLGCLTTLIGLLPGGDEVAILLDAAFVHDAEDLQGFLIGRVPVVQDIVGIWQCGQTLRLGAIQAQALFLCLQRPDCTALLLHAVSSPTPIGTPAPTGPTPVPAPLTSVTWNNFSYTSSCAHGTVTVHNGTGVLNGVTITITGVQYGHLVDNTHLTAIVTYSCLNPQQSGFARDRVFIFSGTASSPVLITDLPQPKDFVTCAGMSGWYPDASSVTIKGQTLVVEGPPVNGAGVDITQTYRWNGRQFVIVSTQCAQGGP